MPTRSALKMTYQPLLNRAGLIGARAVEQMADDMRVYAANANGVTADDLATIGWRRSQIDQHGPKAREQAYAASAA